MWSCYSELKAQSKASFPSPMFRNESRAWASAQPGKEAAGSHLLLHAVVETSCLSHFLLSESQLELRKLREGTTKAKAFVSQQKAAHEISK